MLGCVFNCRLVSTSEVYEAAFVLPPTLQQLAGLGLECYSKAGQLNQFFQGQAKVRHCTYHPFVHAMLLDNLRSRRAHRLLGQALVGCMHQLMVAALATEGCW